MAHIIVMGNEKGGSGKSTVSMHIATALVRMDLRVGALDLDLRQRSFMRYIENRQLNAQRNDLTLSLPQLRKLPRIDPSQVPEGDSPDEISLSTAVMEMGDSFDFIVIDCPGSHTKLSQVAHSMADTLVTPLNDSFIDFDLLARIDPDNNKILGPSVYSEMVWSARQFRARAGLPPVDWVALRNRLGAQLMNNKRKVGKALDNLSTRIGFRVAPGFSERVIFRELFPLGLTLLDLRDVGIHQLSMSNLAARQELREMMTALKLPGVSVNF